MNSYILSTNSHVGLAKELSTLSGIPYLDSNIIYFANSEIRTVPWRTFKNLEI